MRRITVMVMVIIIIFESIARATGFHGSFASSVDSYLPPIRWTMFTGKPPTKITSKWVR